MHDTNSVPEIVLRGAIPEVTGVWIPTLRSQTKAELLYYQYSV